MKIKDFDRNFLSHLSTLKQTKLFIENYKVPEIDMDIKSINVALSNIVFDNLNSLDQKLQEGNRYAWNEKISFTTSKISKISKSLSLVKVGGDPASLKEYYFWKEMTSVINREGYNYEATDLYGNVSLSRADVLFGYLRNHCWDHSSLSFNIDDKSIRDLLFNLVLHINDLDETTPNHSKIEELKAYLYPAVDSNIDFLSILKELEKDGGDISLYNIWKKSALRNSRDPKLFKYLFNKIKRSSGYVERKMALIRTAFANNAVDKDLFKLFIKKSTITIRRELANNFSDRISFVTRCRDVIDSIKAYLLSSEEEKSTSSFVMRRQHERLLNRLGDKFSFISYEDFIMESDKDKVLYLEEVESFLNQEYDLAQSGLIYISEEKDYSVQRTVVDWISKENSVWVLPNITDHYCKRILNQKIIGE